MRCPRLDELPSPPPDKIGWPWTEESPQLPDTMPDGSTWPRVSIVTPSYNQGQFIEETIRSVLLQGYQNLEYIIIDGGSTDDSVDIIRKYEPWLAYWTSESDGGQADALQKGFSKTTGTLLGWLNSDDIYLPASLCSIASLHRYAPHALIAGNVMEFDELTNSSHVVRQCNLTLRALITPWRRLYSWHQPGVFFPKFAYEIVGGLDAALRYAMDHDLMCRFLVLNLPVLFLQQNVAQFRLHAASKTKAENTQMAIEVYRVSARYWGQLGERSSYDYYARRMLLHLSLRALKYLLKGNLRDAWASLLGGLHLFAQLTQSPQRQLYD